MLQKVSDAEVRLGLLALCWKRLYGLMMLCLVGPDICMGTRSAVFFFGDGQVYPAFSMVLCICVS